MTWSSSEPLAAHAQRRYQEHAGRASQLESVRSAASLNLPAYKLCGGQILCPICGRQPKSEAIKNAVIS